MIQFNEIFIQLENQGIGHHYSRVNLTAIGICDVQPLHENQEREQTTLKLNL